jgi:hypothetical protein
MRTDKHDKADFQLLDFRALYFLFWPLFYTLPTNAQLTSLKI